MTIQARRDVFQAIADPTRRNILFLIAAKPLTLTAIADEFEISRPAISQQIKILMECGLVSVTQKGRERFCKARFEPMKEVNDWVTRYTSFWNDKLNALEDYLDNEQ